jgi:hypothetical protein
MTHNISTGDIFDYRLCHLRDDNIPVVFCSFHVAKGLWSYQLIMVCTLKEAYIYSYCETVF